MFKRWLVFLYGAIVYLLFLFTVLCGIGFTGGFLVPKHVDSGSVTSPFLAVLINFGLIGIFGLQHILMARPRFKEWWLRHIPEPAERSTYVLLASLSLLLLFWQWRPLTQPIWNFADGFRSVALTVIFWLGWLAVVLSTFLINHFDLFGLRQVYLYLRGSEYTPVKFKQPIPYKIVRHPLMLSFLIAFWATPRMSVGHLEFAIGMTLFIFIGTAFEERDLVKAFGESYKRYQQQVSMIIPFPDLGIGN
jgi:protein-S-isoprenylcysteine O-methyltransferase Ste14